MKITRILPKPLAIGFQEYDLNKAEGYLKYHSVMVRVFEERVAQGRTELERLRRNNND